MSAANEPLLSVTGLSKIYAGRGRASTDTLAVDDVSFDLFSGQTLGMVGESGSGKTTVARCIMRAVTPTKGQIWFRTPNGQRVNLATVAEKPLRRLRPHFQMVFQDPFSSLNPRMTVQDIVAEPLRVHGLTQGRETEDRVVATLRRVGLPPEFRLRYPHAFSGGQRQRIGIARALIMNPSLIVFDESTSALDVSVQAKIIALLRELQQEAGLTYLFIAHNLDVVRGFCQQVAVMRRGQIVEMGPVSEVLRAPRHPYTRILLSAIPSLNPDQPMNFSAASDLARLDDDNARA